MSRIAGILAAVIVTLALLAGPLAAEAQQAAMPVVSWLASTSPEAQGHFAAAFREGLKRQATSKARTSRSNTAGRRTSTLDCRRWPPTSFAARWP